MKVLMLPHIEQLGRRTDGISRVIEAYFKYLPEYGIEMVGLGDKNYDLSAVHAGATGAQCDICHCHGIHWTAEHNTEKWEFKSNRYVVDAVRHAKMVTVPSAWVAETFQRDMHLSPTVIPHGIDWQDWIGGSDNKKYVLWNKNRDYDVCDPAPVQALAERFPTVSFVSTFRPRGANAISNLRVTGLVPHEDMKRAIQSCAVYLATTKETFGIGILEAMASGKPVLGYKHGGIVDIVEHGTNGYLARPNDFDDLMEGLHFCLKHREMLGNNSLEMAKLWPWKRAAEMVAGVYRQAHALTTQEPTASVVIPVYNKSGAEIKRAVESACEQDYKELDSIVVVDDGSDDSAVAEKVTSEIQDPRVRLIRQDNAGVAHARNRGIAETASKYICCLDSDDWMEPTFLGVCVGALENDQSLGIAYTSLYYHKPDGEEGVSPWPAKFDYDRQLIRQNQIPTCCVFRREMWERLGGYRQRYAPKGAGAEDAEFWLRAGAAGWGAQKVTNSALFHYSWQSGIVSSDPDYKEPDWTGWHPWAGRHPKNPSDRGHPFASQATTKRQSHPVRYYDEPIISAIVPVGPGHEKTVVDALDSLEAQKFRHWEAIVVWDTGEPVPEALLKSHPYIQLLETNHKGPGYARNRGAELARAPFILFLDADDWLYPECMTNMLVSWQKDASIVYTDYVGKATVKDPSKLTPEMQRRVYDHDSDKDEAVIGFRAADFDCERVMRQPEVPPFVFCNVTALIPKIWHDDIGGFDEGMPSWEDVDYHWRLARAGRCYVRLPEELMVYRFYTGSRRERGLQMHENLVQYLQDKYAKEEPVGCGPGCGKGRVASSHRIPPPSAMRMAQNQDTSTSGGPIVMNSMSGGRVELRDEEVIRARYRRPQRGDHRIIGPMSQIDYGYRQAGDVFLIHKGDMQSGWFEEIGTQVVEELPVAPPVALPPPKATGEQLAEGPPPPPEQNDEIPGFIMQPGQAETTEPVEELGTILPPPMPIGDAPELFSPDDMTVQQVRELVTSGVVSSAMARIMLEIEQGGKARKTVIGLLEAKI